MSNVIKTGGLVKHALKDSSGAKAMCKMDGNYALDVLESGASVSEKGNHVLKLKLAISDEDERGGMVYWAKPVTGSHSFTDDKTKMVIVVEHIDELGNVLDSAGLSEYKLQIAKAGDFDLDKVAAKVQESGKLFAFLVQKANDDNGTVSSEIKFFTTRDRYTKNVEANTHRVAPRLKRAITAGPTTNGVTTRAVVTDAQRQDV